MGFNQLAPINYKAPLYIVGDLSFRTLRNIYYQSGSETVCIIVIVKDTKYVQDGGGITYANNFMEGEFKNHLIGKCLFIQTQIKFEKENLDQPFYFNCKESLIIGKCKIICDSVIIYNQIDVWDSVCCMIGAFKKNYLVGNLKIHYVINESMYLYDEFQIKPKQI